MWEVTQSYFVLINTKFSKVSTASPITISSFKKIAHKNYYLFQACSETLKNIALESVRSKLLELFSIAWNTGHPPSLMHRTNFLPNSKECSNYKGIVNFSQCFNILSKIIYFRIDSFCEQIICALNRRSL